MHIKTSTFVAAGILALAGTPVALHVLGGSTKSEMTHWAKTLHGGGSAAGHGSATPPRAERSSVQQPSEKPAAPSASGISGKWAVTIEGSQGTLNCLMVLKQEGKKLTGTLSNPHGAGDFPAVGEFADGALTLSVDGKTDHGEMHLAFKGTVKKEDGSLAGIMTSAMGESKWTGRRNKE